MESGQRDRVSVGKAAEIVASKARVYVNSKGYVSVTVFHTDGTTSDLLTRCFGGKCYKHRSGKVWIVSRRSDLRVLAQDLADHVDPLSAVRVQILRAIP